MPRAAILLAVLLLAVACGGAQRTEKSEAMRATPWTLSYADGAANVYTFAQGEGASEVTFEYDPVTPERSSTGHYSGGDPVSTRLPAGDPRIDELWSRVERASSSRDLHVPDRSKGTGAFHLVTPDGDRRFIIERGPALEELDTFVRRFRE